MPAVIVKIWKAKTEAWYSAPYKKLIIWGAKTNPPNTKGIAKIVKTDSFDKKIFSLFSLASPILKLLDIAGKNEIEIKIAGTIEISIIL